MNRQPTESHDTHRDRGAYTREQIVAHQQLRLATFGHAPDPATPEPTIEWHIDSDRGAVTERAIFEAIIDIE
jgi:hypothetical protein